MLILLEGCDLTGKTTLAEEMRADFGLDYFHLGPPEENVLLHHLSFVEALRKAERGIVADRGHWSGLVYGQAGYNPGNELGLAGFQIVDAVFNRLGGVAVHMTATAPAIKRRWARGEDYLDMAKVPEIIDGMQAASALTIATWYEYSIDDTRLGVRDWLKKHVHTAAIQRSVKL